MKASTTTTLSWLGLALLGILIAGGISVAASRLASQQIGLASEPLTAGDALAPAAPRGNANRHPAPSGREHRPKNTSPSGPAPAPEPTQPAPSPALPHTTTPTPASPPTPGEEAAHEEEGGDGGGGDD